MVNSFGKRSLVVGSVVMVAVTAAWAGSHRQHSSVGGIVEASGFRLVVEGETRWEALPTDNGVTMRFLTGGKCVVEVVAGQSAMVRITDPAKAIGIELVVDGSGEMAVQQLKAYSKNLACVRGIFKIGDDWHAEESLSAGDTALKVAAWDSGSTMSAATEKSALLLQLGGADQRVYGRSENDVSVDMKVGGGAGALVVDGSLSEGVDVELRRRLQKWLWSSKH